MQIPAPQIDDYRSQFPEFLKVPDSVIVPTLDRNAELLKPEFKFLINRPLLWLRFVYLFTAHQVYLRFQIAVDGVALSLGMTAPSAAVGLTNSVSASPGNLSKSMQHSQQDWDQSHLTQDLIRTPYGIEFLNILENLMPLGNIGRFMPRLASVV